MARNHKASDISQIGVYTLYVISIETIITIFVRSGGLLSKPKPIVSITYPQGLVFQRLKIAVGSGWRDVIN